MTLSVFREVVCSVSWGCGRCWVCSFYGLPLLAFIPWLRSGPRVAESYAVPFGDQLQVLVRH